MDKFEDFRQVDGRGTESYMAGFPGYPRNFSRDVFIAGLLAMHPGVLKTQLRISALHQGKMKAESDEMSGQMPGRIHHELPGVSYRERLTTYNACDTTALFLIAAEGQSQIDRCASAEFMKSSLRSVESAIGHISLMTDESGLFWERPPVGEDRFGLRVTYWKDSVLPEVNGKDEPLYPVFFTQAHFVAARGLLSAARILKDDSLAEEADRMFQNGIATAMHEDDFLIYRDSTDELLQPSSDELHSLAYIPREYAELLPLTALAERAAEHLQSPYGYICTPTEISEYLSDDYHGDKIWVFEQAMINYGAEKFGLQSEAAIAARIAPFIGRGQELFGLPADRRSISPVPEGNDVQLWSVAAKHYFSGHSKQRLNSWL